MWKTAALLNRSMYYLFSPFRCFGNHAENFMDQEESHTSFFVSHRHPYERKQQWGHQFFLLLSLRDKHVVTLTILCNFQALLIKIMKERQELHIDIQNAIMGLILECKSHSVSPTLCNTTEAGVLVHVVNLSALTLFYPHALSHSLMTSRRMS